MKDQQELTATQFGSAAANYLTSPVHAQGADLDELALRAQLQPLALDIGCGAGHVSYALARGGARHVVAYDGASAMLETVAREAHSRGLGQIEIRAGRAEALPFADATFDLIATRYSVHHWADVPKAAAEIARVLKPDGRVVLIDVTAPENPLLDTALQSLELLRDASHVRDYRITELISTLHGAGLAPQLTASWKLPLQFDSWVARIGTPGARVAALHALIDGFVPEVREYFAIGADRSFRIDAAWIDARRDTLSG